MATILEVLQYHPDYKNREWVWRDNSIDPGSQAQLDTVFEWLDGATKPSFTDLDNRRVATDQVLVENQSPDTTNDEGTLEDLLLRPDIHRKIVRRVVDFQDEIQKALIQIRNEIRNTNPGFDITFDTTIRDRWLTLRDKLREFDAG